MQNGYHDVPPGKLANVVTFLRMRPPVNYVAPVSSDFDVRRVQQPQVGWYRELFRRVGEPWLWFSRLRLSDEELQAILNDSAVDVFALSHQGRDEGLLEFDRRRFPHIEVAFFGVTAALIGKGAGRALLAHGLAEESKYEPEYIWLHTCTADHPSALRFYQKFGFVPYKRAIEIADDPRLSGEIPREIAPHIPVIEP